MTSVACRPSLAVLNPLDDRSPTNWQDVPPQIPCSSFFVSASWAQLLADAYGYVPRYFAAVADDGRVLRVIAVMEIRSLLSGRRGVSLPFSDCCCCCRYDDTTSHELFQFALDYGRKSRWKYLELRLAGDTCPDWPVHARYYGHIVEMNGDTDELYARLSRTTRQNIKKAEQAGVEIQVGNSLEFVRAYFDLQCLTRQRHGIPPQPYYFFRNLHRCLIAKDLGQVRLALYQGQVVAGGVFLHLGRSVIFKYSASDLSRQQLRPNNLLTWRALQWYCEHGFTRLCFGRTELDQEGLRRYKLGWGATEEQIQYYRYDFRQQRFLEGTSTSVPGAALMKRFPAPLLRMLGYFLYRHCG